MQVHELFKESSVSVKTEAMKLILTVMNSFKKKKRVAQDHQVLGSRDAYTRNTLKENRKITNN